jgi:hypothetical protein
LIKGFSINRQTRYEVKQQQSSDRNFLAND